MYWLEVKTRSYDKIVFKFDDLNEAAKFMDACLANAADGNESMTLSVVKSEENPFK